VSTIKKEATISEALYSLQGQPVTVVAANSSSGSPKVRKVALYLCRDVFERTGRTGFPFVSF